MKQNKWPEIALILLIVFVTGLAMTALCEALVGGYKFFTHTATIQGSVIAYAGGSKPGAAGNGGSVTSSGGGDNNNSGAVAGSVGTRPNPHTPRTR